MGFLKLDSLKPFFLAILALPVSHLARFSSSWTHLAKSPQAFDHAKHMLHSRANARLAAVLCSLDLIGYTTFPCALICEVLGIGRLALNQILLAGVGRVTVDPGLVAVQQIRQRMFVMHIG